MFKKICVALLSVILAASLFGCELFMPKTESGEKTITVVFDMSAYDGEIEVSEGVAAYTNKIKEYSVTTKAERLETVLDELFEDKKITYSGQKGSLGLMLTDIDNITLSGNQFFAIYTDDTDNSDVAYGTYDRNGTIINSAVWGATSLSVKNGHVYVFAIAVW